MHFPYIILSFLQQPYKVGFIILHNHWWGVRDWVDVLLPPSELTAEVRFELGTSWFIAQFIRHFAKHFQIHSSNITFPSHVSWNETPFMASAHTSSCNSFASLHNEAIYTHVQIGPLYTFDKLLLMFTSPVWEALRCVFAIKMRGTAKIFFFLNYPYVTWNSSQVSTNVHKKLFPLCTDGFKQPEKQRGWFLLWLLDVICVLTL